MTSEHPVSRTGVRALRVSAADVARAVGVSPATVSYVMNDRPGVSGEVRSRVLAVAAELGYPLEQRRARGTTERTRVLGVIHPDIGNPFYASVSAGAIDAARAQGHEVFLAHTQESSQTLTKVVEAMIARRVGGVLLTVLHPDDGEVVRLLRRSGTAFILMSRRIPNLRADYVGVDDVGAADAILRHVVGHGYSDVAVVTGPRNSTASATRADSFLATAQQLGLPLPPHRRFHAYLDEEGGRRVVRRMLSEGTLPRAIVCGSDAIASGVVGAVRASGARVPEDVAVTGFDGVFSQASMLGEITTVCLPLRRMAALAIEQLIRRIDGTGGPARDFIQPYRIRIGTTCGCARPSAGVAHPGASPSPTNVPGEER
jgi:LacI family transcriptional regulator